MALGDSSPIPRAERLAEAGPTQSRAAVTAFVAGLVLALAEILLFDSHPAKMLSGALVGTCLFGTLQYLTYASKLVPRGTPQEAPHDVEVDVRQPDLSSGFWLIGVATAIVPLAWLIDRLEVGAGFIPGQPFGYAAASLAALAGIAKWERTNGRRLLFDPDANEVRPYAGPRI